MTTPAPAPLPISDILTVQNMATTIKAIPVTITAEYLNACTRSAAFLKNPVSSTSANSSRLSPLRSIGGERFGYLNVINPRIAVEDVSVRTTALQARSNCLAVIEAALDFATKARAAGFDPPDNPFTEIARLNATETSVSAQQARDLVFNMKVYVNLLDAYRAGAIDMRALTISTAQLAHIRLSYEGLGGTGNTATDLLRFLPSIDDVARARVEQSLAALDFSKRVPQILFTLDAPKGTIIGWRRIPDASGYIVKRRAIFSGETSEIRLDNDQMKESTALHIEYTKTHALTFFSGIDENSVCLYADEDPVEHEYFIYRVQAYQVRNESRGLIFSIASSPVMVSMASAVAIQNQIKSLDPTYVPATGKGSISPWPAFAQQILGDPTLDWLLAAVNVRASIQRKDVRDTTRLYSYLSADPNFLLGQASVGKLVKPSDVGAVAKNISDGIQKFGVAQVIRELLSETGIMTDLDGWDLQDTHFDRAGTLETDQSPTFLSVISAIDPDTATLDLKKLATNMSTLLNGGLAPGAVLESGNSGGSGPTEISVPDPEMNLERADGPLQYISSLGDLRDSVIDLTTFDGISKLLRVIRIMNDFGQDRNLPAPLPAAPPPATPTTVEEEEVIRPPRAWEEWDLLDRERTGGNRGPREIY